MGWSSGLIIHCKPCYGNTQLDLADNGINSFLGFSGPTETHHMNLPVRSHPSSFLGLTANLPLKPPSSQKPPFTLLMSLITEKRWCCLWPLLEDWPVNASDVHRRDTRNRTTRVQSSVSTRLVSGCWWDSLKRNKVKPGNFLDHGMGHTEWLNTVILMLQSLRSVFPKRVPSRFTKVGYAYAHLHSLPATTGMGIRERGLDDL